MSNESGARTDAAAKSLREAREGVGSLQFFVAAMAAQLRDMQVKLGQIDAGAVSAVGAVGQSDTEARLERERDAALEEVNSLRTQIEGLESQVGILQTELERQRVTFADHHAAKQEIARLRAELESAPEQPVEVEDKTGQRKRWQIGRP
jgi:chromosome segregation ATPase